MFGPAAHGWVAAAAWDDRLVNEMKTTQTHNYATLELETHLQLDRSSGEFSGICPPRGCGGGGCEAVDSQVEGTDSRCHDTTDATNHGSADPTKPTE